MNPPVSPAAGPVEAIIALGGNLGDVRQSFIGARDMLAALHGVSLIASSCIYRSPPMGPQDQADYLNAAVLITTGFDALSLLKHMQAIELHFGRRRDGRRWGERTLDLDLIAHDDTQMQSHELTLPHPGVPDRMFVLQPLCDILPDWRHPATGRTARDMLGERMAAGDTPLGKGEFW